MINPRLRRLSLVALLSAAGIAFAAPVPVRFPQGTLHGFLELRAEDGRVVASGDVTQVVHGSQLTNRTIFHFKDGSIDDEITVFTQRGTLHLVTDHHIQSGPFFPHPTDVLVDTRSGLVTVRTTDKDGKQDVKTDHMTLPPDLANGLVPLVLENLPSASASALTQVSMVVLTPKPRIVKIDISSVGEDSTSIVGITRKAIHYEIKIQLGGVVGVVAPLIGKAPPNIQIWVIGGDAPTFAREQGPLYAEGPVMTIQLASPAWPNAPAAPAK